MKPFWCRDGNRWSPSLAVAAVAAAVGTSSQRLAAAAALLRRFVFRMQLMRQTRMTRRVAVAAQLYAISGSHRPSDAQPDADRSRTAMPTPRCQIRKDSLPRRQWPPWGSRRQPKDFVRPTSMMAAHITHKPTLPNWLLSESYFKSWTWTFEYPGRHSDFQQIPDFDSTGITTFPGPSVPGPLKVVKTSKY